MAPTSEMLAEIEHYYDEVPRRFARVDATDAFTVFLPDTDGGTTYYARPLAATPTSDDVASACRRLHDHGAPVAIEWIGDLHPRLAALARDAGLHVAECPLMVLARDEPVAAPTPQGVTVERLAVDHARLGAVNAAIGAAFGDSDDVPDMASPASVEITRRLRADAFRQFGAWDAHGALGGGGHSPRGAVTELSGIGVIPRGRSRGVAAAITAALVADARALGVSTVFLSAATERVASIYARLGFVTIGTACIAEAT